MEMYQKKALRKYFEELRDKENKINNEQDRANDEDIEKIVQLLLRKKEEIGALGIQLNLFHENDEKEKISLNDDNEIETEDINTKVLDLSKIQV
ncbi:hypothetical protein RhiirA5_424105 [Rhizophagus irregularis]|uniref:Uncharacterized protein n=1 Tax=Rhizophagus irregularis TaxID=588596 RepID=A0A2N0P8T2_9GLOM|nr:hypothetical protein RhiirA5_424105 [Rhizophagus irregularis]